MISKIYRPGYRLEGPKMAARGEGNRLLYIFQASPPHRQHVRCQARPPRCQDRCREYGGYFVLIHGLLVQKTGY